MPVAPFYLGQSNINFSALLKVFIGFVALLAVSSCQIDRTSIREGPQYRRLPDTQLFAIDPTRDTVLFGQEGTVITILANSLINAQGHQINDTLQVHLIEAFGLGTHITNGMDAEARHTALALDFFLENESLQVVDTLPLHVQIPSKYALENPRLIAGQQQADGTINWSDEGIAPQLQAVPFSTLPFHPRSFAEELKAHLPFGSLKSYSIHTADSLYFSFAGGKMTDLISDMPNPYIQEAYDNPAYQVINGSYTTTSFQVEGGEYSHGAITADIHSSECGIDPIQVAVLKENKWKNTYLATQAFARRLTEILAIGDQYILDLYVNNLDQALYLTDQIAAQYLESKGLTEAAIFQRFVSEGLTNTQKGARYAPILRRTLARRVNRLKKQIDQRRAALDRALQKQHSNAEILIDEYRDILWQREKHRMTTYSFTWTQQGWMWLHAPPIHAKDTITYLNVQLEILNALNYNELHAYIVYPDIDGLYKLNTSDQRIFYTGGTHFAFLPTLKHQQGLLVAVGYRNDKLYLGSLSIRLSEGQQHQLALKPSSKKALNRLIRPLGHFSYHSSLQHDLKYSRALKVEQIRQNEQWSQQYILYVLGMAAFPNCNQADAEKGKLLIHQYCSPCHNLKSKLTGPAMLDVFKRNRTNKAWFMRFTHNSQAMIQQGDPQAVELWAEWAPTVMSSHLNLSIQDLQNIYHYLEIYE